MFTSRAPNEPRINNVGLFCDVRRFYNGYGCRGHLVDGSVCLALRADIAAMFDLILGAFVSAGLMVYLVWALVRPEDF
jgi:K+-transporting ATPase KdpF subunit